MNSSEKKCILCAHPLEEAQRFCSFCGHSNKKKEETVTNTNIFIEKAFEALSKDVESLNKKLEELRTQNFVLDQVVDFLINQLDGKSLDKKEFEVKLNSHFENLSSQLQTSRDSLMKAKDV